jgi:hypothetical protein
MARKTQKVVPLFVVLPTSRVEVPLPLLRERVLGIVRQACDPSVRAAAKHRAAETVVAIDRWAKAHLDANSLPGDVFEAHELAWAVANDDVEYTRLPDVTLMSGWVTYRVPRREVARG